MKYILVLAILAGSVGTASATPEPAFCEMVASLARSVAEDRYRGISYSAEMPKLKAAAQDLPSSLGILTLSKSALKTVYLDLPKITPDGAYKLHYFACISAK